MMEENLLSNDQQHGSWCAELNMRFAVNHTKTVLTGLRHIGPLRVQRPFYPEGDVCHVYLLHPPGGLVGGDQLAIDLHCESGSHALLTTPGSTKFYRSDGEQVTVNQQLYIESGACLEWFPQENIFFPGAMCKLNTVIKLATDAKFIGWEISCLGRPVNNERFLQGSVDARLSIDRDNKPILLERLRVKNRQQLNAPAGLRNYPMQATFIATGCTEAELNEAREILAKAKGEYPCGATLVDDLLLVRVLGERTEKIQTLLIPIWQALRPAVVNRSATLPRIWAT